MNILHISDFHYSGETPLLKKIIPAITSSLKQSGKSVDFILFTGDLVDKGNVKRHFEDAKVALFDKLASELNVAPENIIFTPGNHDIDYGAIRPSLNSYFKGNIKTNKELDKLYLGELPDKFSFQDSLRPLDNYLDFLKKYHTPNDINIVEDLYSIHYRTYNEQKIAFVSVYSPWLCNLDCSGGKNDYGSLLLPEAMFDEIATKLDRDVSKKILLVHHPISFLQGFNSYEIENHIYDEYDMLFIGHIHKMANVSRHNGINGIYEHTTKASLAKKEIMGCTLIQNDDLEDHKFYVQEITYIRDSNECHMGSPIMITIPIGTEKEERSRVRKKVYEKIEIEKVNADNLLLLKKEDSGKDFLASYNTPLIKRSKEDAMSASISAPISMEDLYSCGNSVIVLGKDKCGKTSLLRRIQLELLMNYTSYNKIPLFLDAKEEEHKIDDSYDIYNLLRSYLGTNRKMTAELMESQQLVLLVDNFRPLSGFANYLQNLIKVYPNVLFIAVGEDNCSTSYEISRLELGDHGCGVLYFHDLRRREIIQYTDQQLSNVINRTEVQERIIKLCKQMELPYNYWTISLFLLIHHKSSDTYSKNLFSILDVCVDEIFGKKKLLLMKSQVTFDQLKSICASLAAYLFEYHESTVYSATEEEILSFLDKTFEDNVRIIITPMAVFQFYVACGMLKLCENNRYTFRLNGFFEYFLACHMTKSESFRDKVLGDDKLYLGFKNQLEIYSGLKHNDSAFLQYVYQKTKDRCSPIFNQYDENKDKELLNKLALPNLLSERCKRISIKNALSSTQRAEVEDIADGDASELKSEVHLIVQYDPNQLSVDLIGRYLMILARVFKNIDEINDTNISGAEIFSNIISYYCDYSFYLIEELSAKAEAGIDENDFSTGDDFVAELELLKLLSNFSPLITQMEVFDGLGHYTIIRLVKEEIERLKLDSDNNQYKLFILYFLLCDLTLEGSEDIIEDAIRTITKLPILRYMMLLKLNYYLAFRSEDNLPLQQFLAKKIREVKLLLDNKTDASLIDKGIQDSRRSALIHKKIQ